MKILLVEDSATLRHAHQSFLEKAGHSVMLAESGEHALQAIELNPIDMVIMDVEMPGLNGFETTRLMREWLGDYWIPIIFVTGISDDESFRIGIEAGGDDYLIKPVSPIILKAKIKAMERIIEMRDQLRKLNADLETLSRKDSLTQVYNRRSFEEFSQQQWLVANRNCLPLSVLMIDIDHFKQFNDFYGHPAGDSCLVQVAKTIEKNICRPTDMLARYGGEEFIVLLPDTDEEGAIHVANTVRHEIESLHIKHQPSPTSRWVTVSIGISMGMGAGVGFSEQKATRSLNEIISCADKALYKSKHDGRNRITSENYFPLKNLLIVDSNPISITQLRKELEGHCQLITVDSEEDCLDLAISLQPELILINPDTPEVNGSGICKKLQTLTPTQHIPTVLFSSEPRKENMKQHTELLYPPFNRSNLLEVINKKSTALQDG